MTSHALGSAETSGRRPRLRPVDAVVAEERDMLAQVRPQRFDKGEPLQIVDGSR